MRCIQYENKWDEFVNRILQLVKPFRTCRFSRVMHAYGVHPREMLAPLLFSKESTRKERTGTHYDQALDQVPGLTEAVENANTFASMW